MLIMTQRERSLPYGLVVTLITLATICQKQAISISDQPASTAGASESQLASVAQASTASLPAQVSHGTTTTTTSTTTEATSVRMPKQRNSSAHHHYHQQAPPAAIAATKQSGRARKTATARHQPQQELTTNNAQQSAVTEPAEADGGQLAEAIKLMHEYRNTPPVFLTPTRDFYVDVARFSLGYKVATMQAVDSEGDRLEYSLKPASYRDASAYFVVNATSGELLFGGDQLEDQEAPSEATYHLNVAASDGAITTVVELQIHVFNTSALGTKSPVQLTIEGGRRDTTSESLMRAKTSEFFDRLYGGPSRSSSTTASQRDREKLDNSTIVIPSFVNPGLIMPDDQIGDLELSAQVRTSSSPTTSEPQHSDAETTFGRKFKAAADTAASAVNPQHARLAQQLRDNRLAPLIDQSGEHAPLAHSDPHQQQQPAPLIMQHSLVMSLIMIVGSCLVIVFVLLVFIVPLSVKRLKRRLKNMEMQHEQLSQKTSSNASSSSGGSTLAGTGSRAHLPSLSQFTLASGASGSVLHHDNHVHSHHNQQILQQQHAQYYQHQRMTLGRQVSLDSALTSSGEYGGDASSHLPQNNNNYTYHLATNQLHQSPFFSTTNNNMTHNGQLLNRINNGAIVNPMYMQQAAHQMQPGLAINNHQHASDAANIYCPIDDENYTTINTELPGQVGSLVGQTSDSRAYFGSGCAATPSSFSRGRAQRFVRDSHSPDSQSSRSSTRSLARFLSLPARRHSAHHQNQTQEQDSKNVTRETVTPEAANKKRKTTTGSFLAELEYHFRASDDSDAPPQLPAPPATQHAAQTIARASRISQEQQVRHKRQRCGATSEGRDSWEIERHRLTFLEILGEGQFGQVWRCKLRLTASESGLTTTVATSQTVAVKTLKKCAAKGPRERDELLAEIEVMKLVCDHPNVVRILHCCTSPHSEPQHTGGPILLVMEHVELGKLQALLEKSRASHQYATTKASNMLDRPPLPPPPSNDWYAREGGAASSSLADYADTTSGYNERAPPDALLTSRELVKFMYHIAKGMEYVASQAIVHRDLASRNILLSGQRVCKIGDFGMARHMASVGDIYERRSRNTKVPVRWMAPEVLLENSFTTKSDVFSFGILMWEIATLGSTPYTHLKTEQIIEAVARRGERPERPEYCHTPLYSIMSACWQEEATRRPSFSDLVKQLDALLMSGEEYIELDQYSDHNYYNIDKTTAPLELL